MPQLPHVGGPPPQDPGGGYVINVVIRNQAAEALAAGRPRMRA
jgi:hypothetical protein